MRMRGSYLTCACVPRSATNYAHMYYDTVGQAHQAPSSRDPLNIGLARYMKPLLSTGNGTYTSKPPTMPCANLGFWVRPTVRKLRTQCWKIGPRASRGEQHHMAGSCRPL